MTLYRIGSNVDSFCSKCKLTLAHTIEVVVEGTIKRVHCNTCKAKHAFRGQTSVKSATKSVRVGTSSAAKKKGTPGLVRASDFSTLLKGRSPAAARQYSFADRFRAGEMLSHTTFGIGVVTADKGAGKIEVLFELGPRTLIHGKSAQ
jgi:hypothetical protein